MKRETDRFYAISETGEKYLIIEYTDFLTVSGLGSSRKEEIPGLKEYRTSNGMYVNVAEDDVYEIVNLGLTVRKVPR